jgi:predicted Zn-dependent protease
VVVEAGDSPASRRTRLVARQLADERAEADELVERWLADDDTTFLRVVADAYETAGARDDAIATLARLRAARGGERAIAAEARLLLDAGRAREAAPLACAPAAATGDDAWQGSVLGLCARAAARAGQPQLATALLDELRERLPSAWRVLDAERTLAGEDDLALRVLAERVATARTHAPTDPDLVELAARLAFDRDGASSALAIVDEALAARPSDRELLFVRARVLERGGEALAAAQLVERVMLRSDAPLTEHLNFVAYTLADTGARVADALPLAWRAVLRDPLNGYIVDTLGWAQANAGLLDDAHATLTRALRLSPDEPEIMFHLATVVARRGDPTAAAAILTRAAPFVFDDERLARRIADLARELGGPS